MTKTLASTALLWTALLFAAFVGSGCLIDRGPLPTQQTPEDATDAADLDAARDAADLGEDAALDAAFDASFDASVPLERDVGPLPDAYADDAFQPDACVTACDGNFLVGCEGSASPTRTLCPYACGGSPPRCLDMLTSNFRSSTLFNEGSAELVIDTPRTIDTTSLATRSMRDGTSVALLVYSSITISSTLTVVGPVPLALIARDGIVVSGTIELSASGATPGPGGNAGATSAGADAPGSRAGRGGGESGTYDDGGGGGGGSCGTGGAGGRGGDAGGGNGGGASNLSSDAESLRGGGGGGAGNRSSGFGGGGGGGGGLQLSTRGTLEISGTIHARGAGGGGGREGTNWGSGGGGGAGGFVVLEAPIVVVSGTIDLSGGGGGSGRNGGSGGGGGGGTSSPGAPGGSNTSTWGNGGGGGGGAGCLVVRSRDAFVPSVALSPRDAIGLHTLGLLTDG